MKTALRVAALLAIGALAACATRPDIQYTQDTNFARYKTFSWLPVKHESPVKNPILDSKILDKRVKAAAINVLTGAGYRHVQGQSTPDFVVTYQTASEHETRESGGFQFGVGVGYPFYDPFFNPFFGRLYVPGQPYNVDTYLRGDLIIDIIDADTHDLVWRGWTGALVRADNFDRDSVRAMVETILSRFPPP